MTNPPQPWFSRLELACEPTAVRWARMHARAILKQWEVPESVIDDAELVVSELTTNAVRHSGSAVAPPPSVVDGRVRRFVLTLWCFPDHIHIYVYDQDRTPPVLRPPSLDDNGGRGLRLVEELSSKWGYAFPTPHPDSGKAVWAQLDFPGEPAPTDLPAEEQAHLPPPRRSDAPTWHDDPATMTEVVTRLRDRATPTATPSPADTPSRELHLWERQLLSGRLTMDVDTTIARDCQAHDGPLSKVESAPVIRSHGSTVQPHVLLAQHGEDGP